MYRKTRFTSSITEVLQGKRTITLQFLFLYYNDNYARTTMFNMAKPLFTMSAIPYWVLCT